MNRPNPFLALFYLAVLIAFLAISVPIGILMIVLDIDPTYEENVPAGYHLPLRSERSPEGLPNLERAGRTEVPA